MEDGNLVTSRNPEDLPAFLRASRQGPAGRKEMKGHTHDHHVQRMFTQRRLIWALVLNFAFLVLEAVGGLLTGSLALLADAGHIASALILSPGRREDINVEGVFYQPLRGLDPPAFHKRNHFRGSVEIHRLFGVPKGNPFTYETFLGCVHPGPRVRRPCMAIRPQPDRVFSPYEYMICPTFNCACMV